MAKVLRCSDLMPGCSYEARGDSEEAVLAQAIEHAKAAHNLNEISPERASQVRDAIRGAIRDEQASAQKASS